MFLHVEEAKYIREYTVWVRFNDGCEGELDLSDSLEGEIFNPLKREDYFKNFALRFHTLSWDNGADFAPEFLHERLAQQGGAADCRRTALFDPLPSVGSR